MSKQCTAWVCEESAHPLSGPAQALQGTQQQLKLKDLWCFDVFIYCDERKCVCEQGWWLCRQGGSRASPLLATIAAAPLYSCLDGMHI